MKQKSQRYRKRNTGSSESGGRCLTGDRLGTRLSRPGQPPLSPSLGLPGLGSAAVLGNDLSTTTTPPEVARGQESPAWSLGCPVAGSRVWSVQQASRLAPGGRLLLAGSSGTWVPQGCPSRAQP